MKKEIIRRFVRLCRHGEPINRDGDVAVCPREYYGYSRQIGCRHSFILDVVRVSDGAVAGEIALRIGDSPEQFYLGHIGYHIDPPFQGHAYALKACRLCEPLLTAMGLRSVVITTDPDNLPSVKTCEHLGCQYESTVRVSSRVKSRLEISDVKRRYLWELNPQTSQQLARP